MEKAAILNVGRKDISRVNVENLGGQNRDLPSTGPQRPPLAPPRPPFPAPRGRPPVFGTTQQARDNKKPQAGGRIYCLEAKVGGDGDPHAVVSGTFLINVVLVTVLFDAGATHFFISLATAN